MTSDTKSPTSKLLCWRRIDMPGFELLRLTTEPSRVLADSTVICGWAGGYKLNHLWELSPDWRAVSLRIERSDARGRTTLALLRDGDGWRVNGERRPDLDGAAEPDLSVTPFCNTLVMRRTPVTEGASLTVDTAYVDGDDLSVARSRQRYDYKSPGLFRYVDLGLSAGFEADLEVDSERLVRNYQHLFERVQLAEDDASA